MGRQTIYIECLGLVEGHFSGIGQYILGVLKGIDQCIDEARLRGEEVPRVRAVIPRDSVHKFLSFGLRNIRYKTFPLPFRYMAALWHRGKMLPIDLWCGKGTYIFTRFVDMPLIFSKSILVIYDLSFELHRQYSDEGNARFLSKFTRKSVGRAQKIVTISKNARREIIDFYGLSSDVVKIAYPATDENEFYRRSTAEIEKVKRLYGINGDYVLALSNLEPRKNLAALVEAYCNLPKEVTDRYALLLVGVSGWKTEALFDYILSKVDAGYNIVRPTKYVLDADKPALISGASLLVYPSHYEGFGMPPVEALSCGVPVITADNSSLPEAVGSAGQLIDIHRNGLLKTTIQKTLKDIDAVTAQALTAGPRQAATFSWKTSAQVILDTAREID